MGNLFPFPGRDTLIPNILRAENCTLTDADGKQYLDMESGIWCTSVGHANPAVTQALMKQAERIAHTGFCYSAPVVDRAAGAILDLLEHAGGRCAFLCSGSEAVEYGTRVLRQLYGPRKILTMSDSYFGAYGDAAAKDAESWFLFDWNVCDGCGLEHCSDACPHYSAVPFGEICAFLFEPGSSSGMVRFPPFKLVQCIAQDVSGAGGTVMVNEVTTGIGRTGKWFGFQHYGLQPDIVAMGKGIGNGYPVSATSLSKRIVSLLEGKPAPYGQSHLNDPLGAAVAEAVIALVRKEELIQRAEELSAILIPGLQRIGSNSNLIECVRGRGLMAVLVMAGQSGVSAAARLHKRLFERGILVDHRQGNPILRMDPALTIEAEELRRFLSVLEETLDAMGAEFQP